MTAMYTKSVYSKYHDDTGSAGVPFPGADAVALAAGMPDEPKPQEAPAPAVVRLCIDCRYCTDLGAPRRHGNLVCVYPDPYLRTGVFYAYDRRRSETYCGEDARWFEDAINHEASKN